MDINSLCSISMPEPRQLLVKPYSREDLKTIAAAIGAANLGINPQVEADAIRSSCRRSPKISASRSRSKPKA
jgi:ribosome recycling factor